jgi:hypothetical protein
MIGPGTIAGRRSASWLWLAPGALGGALTALIMLVMPPDRTLHGFGDFLLNVSPLLLEVITIALFPTRRGWSIYLPVLGFVAYLGYIDSAFGIEVGRLVDAAQAHAEQAQFAQYYRFSLFVNAFVVLFGLFCFRMGGGSTARSLKLGVAGILLLISGLNDLTIWAMYEWPGGVRPDTFYWASHVSIFLGREAGLTDMLVFVAVHLALVVTMLRLPLERWLGDR